MKFKELAVTEVKKLHEVLKESQVKLRELNFSVANNQVKNVREIRQVKKTIAQVLTALNQRNQK
jgi:ribosomal protein L29